MAQRVQEKQGQTSTTTTRKDDKQTSSTQGGVTTTTQGGTTTTTQVDPYKTEFVKVYQDAGVIGVAMLTLLVICVLLAILTFRLAKMYSNLITARDSLDAARVTVIEKLTENILGIRTDIHGIRDSISTVRSEVIQNRDESSRARDNMLAEFNRVCDRILRATERRATSNRRKSEKG